MGEDGNTTMSMDRIMTRVIDFTRENTHPFYFRHHASVVGETAAEWAERLSADVNICRAAGYLHDIGYSQTAEKDMTAHIIRGALMAEGLLAPISPPEFCRRVISCIRTHDGFLEDDSPLENRIVNDADAGAFLMSPFEMAAYAIFTLKFPPETVKDFLVEHAHRSYDSMVIPEVKAASHQDYHDFIKRIGGLR